MNRKLISKALSNIDDRYIAETLLYREKQLHHTPERTSKMGKFENTNRGGHSRRLLGLILAACLVFSLAITAYAANIWGIREMFRTPYRELPEAAEGFIQQHTETAQAEDWNCRITESLCDTSKIMVTVMVSGGDKYILAPTDAMPEDKVGMIGLSGEQTLADYAKSQGKELLFVGARIDDHKEFGITNDSQIHKNISDSEMTILVESGRGAGADGGDAICIVYARDNAGNRMNLELPFKLEPVPTEGERVYVAVDPDAIPGLSVGEATVKETPLGISVRWMETTTDQEARYNIMKVEIEGVTYREGGSVLEDDGNCYFQFSMGEGNVGDTMTVHFYDWDEQPIGDIVFKRK